MRILLRLPNWVGDVVMATPALRALRRRFGRDEIVVVGRPHLVGMLEGAGWFDRAIAPPPKGGLLGPVRFGRLLSKERFDLALLFPNSWSSAITALAAGIPRRLGYEKAGRGILLTEKLRPVRVGRLRPIPMVDYYLRLCELAGCRCGEIGKSLELPASEAAVDRAARYHRALGLAEGERPVALSIGASFGPAKGWTLGGWAAVADHFCARGRRVLFYGVPSDRPAIEAIMAASRERGALAATDVPLADLCAHMKRCALLISTDSGGRHVGVAAGIPVVSIMGPTHPNYSELDSGRYVVLLEKVECWPCHLRDCPIDHRCMTRITPERVIAAAEEFLAGRAPFGGARPWVTRAGEECARFVF